MRTEYRLSRRLGEFETGVRSRARPRFVLIVGRGGHGGAGRVAGVRFAERRFAVVDGASVQRKSCVLIVAESAGCVRAMVVVVILLWWAWAGSASGASSVSGSGAQLLGARLGLGQSGLAGGAAYQLGGDPFVVRARLSAAGREDRFGSSVAEAGDLVFVGAPNAKVGVGLAQGAVYVFSRPAGGRSGSLHEVAKLVASGRAGGEQLGSSVAVFGSTVVAGAPWGGFGTRGGRGAVYVFVEPKRGWSGTIHSVAKLTASDGVPGDSLGSSVAVSGDTIVGGAPGATLTPYGNEGAVYVFARPAKGWSGSRHQTRKLTVPGAGENAQLGYSVAISGRSLVAGAPGPVCYGFGAVYVFTTATDRVVGHAALSGEADVRRHE